MALVGPPDAIESIFVVSHPSIVAQITSQPHCRYPPQRQHVRLQSCLLHRYNLHRQRLRHLNQLHLNHCRSLLATAAHQMINSRLVPHRLWSSHQRPSRLCPPSQRDRINQMMCHPPNLLNCHHDRHASNDLQRNMNPSPVNGFNSTLSN